MGAPAAAGTKLGRYQIVKHLASGGMAEVLLARATGIEGFTRHVVIKRIRPAQAKDPAFVQMFLNEARLAAQLHHHNIVQVHDIGQEGNEYFFAMEYVHGEDLRRLLTHLARHKQKLPLEHVVTIISAAALAIHHAHEQLGPDRKPLNIVHRDVTPANILVGYDGNVKVVDFGIAKAAVKTTEVTVAGALKGKASYMSPEQCTGSAPVDRRSDVFALGVTMYELATTRRLFKGENDFLTMSSIVGGKIPPPTTHRPDMPPQLEAIIMKALALKPEDRFQTADQMREALDDFAIEARLRTTTTALAAYMKMQFGEKPEPWLVDDNEDMVISIDFDGSASGMAMAPQVSVETMDLPESVPVAAEAPIIRARTKAISHAPPLRAQIPALSEKPARTPTRQIPVVNVQASSDVSKPVRRDVTPVPAGPAKRKTMTVQIPTTALAAAAGAPPRAESSGVPLPGVAAPSDSQAVRAVPRDVDATWDASRAVQAPAREPSSKIAQPAALAQGTATDAKASAPVTGPKRVTPPAGMPIVAGAPASTTPGGTPAPVATANTPSAGTPAPATANTRSAGTAASVATANTGTPAPNTPSAGTPAPATANTPSAGASAPNTPSAGTVATANTGTPAPVANATPPAAAAAGTPASITASTTPPTGSSATAAGAAKPATTSASTSGGWSPTKLLGLKDKPAGSNDSSSRIPSLKDKPVGANDSSSRVAAGSNDSSSRVAAGSNDSSSRLAPDAAKPGLPAPRAGVAAPKATALGSSSRIPGLADKRASDGAALFSTNIAPEDAAEPASDFAVQTEITDPPEHASGPTSTGARDSAPALPPPPAIEPIPLAAGAEAGDASAGTGEATAAARASDGESESIAARFAPATVAPAMYPSAKRYLSPDNATPAAWPAGSSAVETPSVVDKLLGTPQKKKIAIAAGGAVLLIVILVFALGGGKKSSTQPAGGPDTKHDTEMMKPDPVEKADTPDPVGHDTGSGAASMGSDTTGGIETTGGTDTTGGTATTNTPDTTAGTSGTDTKPATDTDTTKTPDTTAVTKTTTKKTTTDTTAATKTTKKTTTPDTTAVTKTTTKTTVKTPTKTPAKTTTKTAATKPVATIPVKKATTTKPTTTTKPAVKKPDVKKPTWDPNSLFPKKK